MKIIIDQRRIYQYSTEDQKSMTGRSKMEVTDGKVTEEKVRTGMAALEEKRVHAVAKRDFRQKRKILLENVTEEASEESLKEMKTEIEEAYKQVFQAHEAYVDAASIDTDENPEEE